MMKLQDLFVVPKLQPTFPTSLLKLFLHHQMISLDLNRPYNHFDLNLPPQHHHNLYRWALALASHHHHHRFTVDLNPLPSNSPTSRFFPFAEFSSHPSNSPTSFWELLRRTEPTFSPPASTQATAMLPLVPVSAPATIDWNNTIDLSSDEEADISLHPSNNPTTFHEMFKNTKQMFSPPTNTEATDTPSIVPIGEAYGRTFDQRSPDQRDQPTPAAEVDDFEAMLRSKLRKRDPLAAREAKGPPFKRHATNTTE